MSSNHLKLIIGPMFSSKSSSLLSEIKCASINNQSILVINNILDKSRHSDMNIINNIGYIKTHNNIKFPAIMLTDLNELKTNLFLNEKYRNSDVIIIDEGQFYSDLFTFIKNELSNLNQNKTFIIAGLSSDYKMEPIGDIIKLIPLADSIEKLSARCFYCNCDASFTKLINKSQDALQINVGGSEKYVPTCRNHFYL